MSLETQVAALTTATTTLTQQVVTSKQGLDSARDQAVGAKDALQQVIDDVALGANSKTKAVGADLLLGAGSKIASVAADLALGAASKIAKVAADLALGAASKIAMVAADMALGGGASFILRAPQAAQDATTKASEAANSATGAAGSAATATTKAGEALTYRDATAALAGIAGTFLTKDAATTALGTIAANAFVQVMADETRSGRRALYQKVSGALVFVYDLGGFGRTSWVDTVAGNDTTGIGSGLQPYATFNKALAMSSHGDVIRLAPNAVIKETIVSTLKGITIIGHATATIQCHDDFAGSWALASGATNTYQGTITHLWGNVGSKNAANRWYPNLLCAGRQLMEIRVVGPSPDVVNGTYTQANEAAALAYVEANPGTYYVKGKNGSSYSAGWEAGDQTYYVHAFDNAAPTAVKVGQRAQSVFGLGCSLTDITVFGGVAHNGMEAQQGNWNRVRIYFPPAHGCFCAGTTGIDCAVIGASKSAPTAYAFHSYNDVVSFGIAQRTYMLRPQIINWDGPYSTGFGCHGGTGVTTSVVGLLEVDDLYGLNVNSLCGVGLIANGAIFRRPKVLNLGTFGSSSVNVVLEDPAFAGGSINQQGALWSSPSPGATLTIYGGRSAATGTFFANAVAGAGSVTFNDHLGMVAGDAINGRWYQRTAAHGGLTFNRCIMQGDAGDELLTTLSAATSGGDTVAFNDCAISGITLPTGATLANTAQGGRLGLYRDAEGLPALAAENVLPDLGDVVKSMTAGSFYAFAYSLSTAGVRRAGGSLVSYTIEFATPAGVTLNGLTRAPGTTNWVIAYGAGGKLYKSQYNGSGTWTEVTTGRSTGWVGAIAGTDANCWLLGSAGEITQYNADTDTFTDRTSGVAYPLLGGVRNGTLLVAWGADAGQTVGGVIVSTDTGPTWGSSLATGDATPAGIGAYAVRVRPGGGYVNGNYFVLTSKGVLLTSTTGASGSWTARTLPLWIDARTCAVDTTSNRILLVGDSITGGTRAVEAGLIDASGAATAWMAATQPVDIPLPNLGAVAFVPGAYTGVAGIKMFVAAGKLAQFAVSEDVRGWKRGRPRRVPVQRSRGVDPRIAQLAATA